MANITPFAALDCEAIVCIVQAYDSAWHSLRGSIFASVPRAEETRDILIRRIIEIAEHGECDPARLRDGALRHFGLAA
jgi:hypothetical protein